MGSTGPDAARVGPGHCAAGPDSFTGHQLFGRLYVRCWGSSEQEAPWPRKEVIVRKTVMILSVTLSLW